LQVWRDHQHGDVHLRGRLGVGTVSEVRAVLHDAVDAGGGDLVVVLRETEVVDATGLGLFVALHRHAMRAGGRLVLREASPRLVQLLTTTRLYGILNVEPASAAA